MRILVTRPQAEALATRDKLVALGHRVVVDPMLTITIRLEPLPPGPFDAALVTSGNAVAALAGRPEASVLARLPVAAVGKRTAAMARAAGFIDVTSTGRDVDSLVAHIARSWRSPRRILYLAGSDRSADLAARLAPLGHDVSVATVYEARKATAFDAGVRAEIRSGAIDAVLHYSVRTAEAFVSCCGDEVGLRDLALRHLCLSAKVGEVLRSAGAGRVAVAERPDEEALFLLLPS
jgi:uroporphyrinogen-III synthase